MARGRIWSGMLNFVLLSIPVEIVKAVQPGRISFHLLHRTDHARLHRRMYCPSDKTYVHAEHIVNGYEVGAGKYVVVREEEYERIEPESSHSIQIQSFVDFDQIDPLYYDRPYFLMPRKGGERPYQLLHTVMRDSGRAGAAKFVMHGREHLAAIWPMDRVLGLMLLHFAADVRDREEFIPKQAQADSQQVEAMIRVMEKMKGTFEPENYEDTYRQRMEAYLKEKAGRGETVRAPEEVGREEELAEFEEDLIEALEESLAQARGK